MSSEPKQLPIGWMSVPFRDVVFSRKGKKPNVLYNETSSDRHPYVLIDQMEGKPTRYFTDDSKVVLASKNDVLLVWDGSIGKCSLGIEGAVGSTIVALTPIVIEPKFLELFIKHSKQKLLDTSRGVALQHINQHVFWSLPFPVVPLNEQKRLIRKSEGLFSELDASIEDLEVAQAELKRYRASVLVAACSGKLVPTEAEIARSEKRSYENGTELLARILKERCEKWSGRGKYKEPATLSLGTSNKPLELPEGWVLTNVEQITSLVTSGSRGWGDFYSSVGALFIRAQDIKTDSLRMSGVARVEIPEGTEGVRSSVENLDLLITITGANVTKSALVSGLNETAFVSQHVALLKPVCREISPFMLNWIISPVHGRKSLRQWAYGAGKPGLSLEQVRSLSVALPPTAEQKRIVAEVERRLSVADEMENVLSANLQRAERLRQSILQQAFTGKLVSQDPNDEPASVLLERIAARRASTVLQKKTASKTRVSSKMKVK